MADRPVVLSPADVARLRKLLAAYESGHFTPPPGAKGGNVTRREVHDFRVTTAIDTGKYWLTLLLPKQDDVAETGPVTAADFGTDYEGDVQYLGINRTEITGDEPALTAGMIVSGVIGRAQSGGSVIVVRIDGYGWEECATQGGGSA